MDQPRSANIIHTPETFPGSAINKDINSTSSPDKLSFEAQLYEICCLRFATYTVQFNHLSKPCENLQDLPNKFMPKLPQNHGTFYWLFKIMMVRKQILVVSCLARSTWKTLLVLKIIGIQMKGGNGPVQSQGHNGSN